MIPKNPNIGGLSMVPTHMYLLPFCVHARDMIWMPRK